jgi:hypothetical protein
MNGAERWRQTPSTARRVQNKDSITRKITLALLALGFIGAIAISAPGTTKAQGIYLGNGVGMQVGTPNRYRYNNRRYYRGYNSYAYDRRPYRRSYYNGYGYSGYRGY